MTVYPNDRRDLPPPDGMGARNAQLARIEEAIRCVGGISLPVHSRSATIRDRGCASALQRAAAVDPLIAQMHTYGHWAYDTSEPNPGEAPSRGDSTRYW